MALLALKKKDTQLRKNKEKEEITKVIIFYLYTIVLHLLYNNLTT